MVPFSAVAPTTRPSNDTILRNPCPWFLWEPSDASVEECFLDKKECQGRWLDAVYKFLDNRGRRLDGETDDGRGRARTVLGSLEHDVRGSEDTLWEECDSLGGSEAEGLLNMDSMGGPQEGAQVVLADSRRARDVSVKVEISADVGLRSSQHKLHI